MDATEASEVSSQILDEIGSAVIADRGFFETVLLGVVAKGHVLLEDVPGTGKTLTARSVATALGLSFSRVQFTPDLLPSDVTGTNIFNEREQSSSSPKDPSSLTSSSPTRLTARRRRRRPPSSKRWKKDR